MTFQNIQPVDFILFVASDGTKYYHKMCKDERGWYTSVHSKGKIGNESWPYGYITIPNWSPTQNIFPYFEIWKSNWDMYYCGVENGNSLTHIDNPLPISKFYRPKMKKRVIRD